MSDEITQAEAELAKTREAWADIERPGGVDRLIDRADAVKGQLRRVAENGYTRGRSVAICEDAAFIISQLTTTLAKAAGLATLEPDDGASMEYGAKTGSF